ncbi:MAG TPA: tetratricopeptide repeat protein [Saprospiraceae bacterium]|nr:tetratricopeptide repeat protein [Saprospiraceae bacterium]
MKNFWKISAVLFAVLLAGCVTQKKKGAEPGWFKKGYHNVTSRYNYWFNADELFRLTEVKLAAEHKDNYNQILDVYPSAATDPQSARGDLDNVIVKASKGIALHRVSDWADDCYTLIGQSQFLKRDYETAESTFKWIKDEYDPKKKNKSKLKSTKKKEVKKKLTKRQKKKAAKKKKKEREKKKKEAAKAKKAGKKVPASTTTAPVKPAEVPKKDVEELTLTAANPYTKGMERTSAFPIAMVWYGRTLTERDKYEEAEFLFRELEEDRFFPETFHDELYTAEANLWIKQKRYDKAIEPLSKAIDRTKKKAMRARLAYILAQLYERAGQSDGAYAALETVLNSAPNYEMEFNARLRQIQAGWTNGKIVSADANKSLERMIKDAKNLEYRDQIYYTMADIALKDGLKKDAITYLRQSLDFNQGNTVQKAESYLKLANLYFESENFVQAKNYFDSTLTVLPATDERFKTVSDYATNLKDIARLITTIAANDSIVRIYRMSDVERKEFGKKLKKQRQEEADAAAKAQAAKATAAIAGTSKAPTPVAGSKPSTFYFYNESFLKKGRKDFNRTWGERKLEDNWRRSNRPNTGVPGDEVASGDSTQNNAVSDAELTDMFKNIPTSEAELSVLHLSTYEAMYQLGTLFRDRLQNNERSTSTLEEMQTRYPETERYEKETWYYCYLGFSDLKNAPRAQYYLDKLVKKYPNSSYARALTDPNFRNSTKEKEAELNKYYEQTYTTFTSGNYQDAYDRCIEAPKKYGSQNPLMAKFALLSALCTGNLQGNEAYCKALQEVIARYPDSPESTRAKEIARVISCKGFEVAETPKKTDKAPIDDAFTREDDKLHYFLIAITGDVRVEDIKASISDYNRENHKLEQLRISNIFLGTDTNEPIIVIRKFDSREQAMRFYTEVSKEKSFLGETDKKTYKKEFFAITQENYRRVLKNKTLSGYREFFGENYLK